MTRLVLVLGLLALLVPAQGLPGSRTAAGGETWIFYYPWYGTPQRDGAYLHWDQGGHIPPFDLASSYYPARGPYSSSDPAVVAAQMRQIRHAGIGGIVVSWWGWGSFEDQRLPLVLRLAHRQGLRVAVQIEPYDGRSPASVGVDLAHLQSLGITRVYVYHPFDGLGEADWAALLASVHGVQVLGQTVNVTRAAAAHFSGVYTYDIVTDGPATFAHLCAAAHQAGLRCEPSVGPGYDALRATGDTHVLPRAGGATYDAMWRAAIAADADAVTITSYNEWHEGTQIEPALTPSTRRFAVSPVLASYRSYAGAYGFGEAAAGRAYLLRTACWTAAFRLSVAGAAQDQWRCAGQVMQPRRLLP